MATTVKEHKKKQAGIKSADTKGREELVRAGKMAWYTRTYGKNDAENPYSRENYYKGKRDPETG